MGLVRRVLNLEIRNHSWSTGCKMRYHKKVDLKDTVTAEIGIENALLHLEGDEHCDKSNVTNLTWQLVIVHSPLAADDNPGHSFFFLSDCKS